MEVVGQRRMPERIVDGRFQIADLLAGVVALPLENHTIEVTLLHELAHGVGQLDLAAGAASCLLQ